ncbi:MAG: hypothetical protein H8E73_05700 [Planctomycetes bacterium]|nr:hypothetical protein [Planctomycetota bacterium]
MWKQRIPILFLALSLLGCNLPIGDSGGLTAKPTFSIPEDSVVENILEPAVQSAQSPVPTPDHQTSVITGRLVTSDRKPYLGGLYLAEVIRANETDAPPLIAFSQESAPHADQNQDGYFVFSQVIPGEYALTLSNPAGQIILKDTGTNTPLIFTAKAGEKLDFGEIIIP